MFWTSENVGIIVNAIVGLITVFAIFRGDHKNVWGHLDTNYAAFFVSTIGFMSGFLIPNINEQLVKTNRSNSRITLPI